MSEPPKTGNLVGKSEAFGLRAYRVLTHPFSSFTNGVTGSITSSALSGMQKYTMEEIADFKKFVLDGHGSWQVLGCIGGIGMALAGFYNVLFDVLNLDPLSAVTDLYIAAFGCLSVCLEYKEGLLPEGARKQLQEEFLFVYKPYGRAFLYVLFGLLMFSISSKITYMVLGPYVTFVGGLVSYYSGQVNKEYQKMRDSQRLDKTHLRSLFNKADKGGFLRRDGHLDSAEFATLFRDLMHLPGPPDINELEMALLEIDSAHDGKISFEELEVWYNKKMDNK